LTSPIRPADVLAFWFADALSSGAALRHQHQLWFRQRAAFDREIAVRFGLLPDAAVQGALDHWRAAAESALALVLVLDQFPRHLHRNTVRAFAYDAEALASAEFAIDAGFDAALHPLHAAFLYMPFQHAEDAGVQQRSVRLYAALRERAPDELAAQFDSFLRYARRHHAVIAQFGRFPHRNAASGRESTPREIAYLAAGGETFGHDPSNP
jgi:uncharacterized protein (DUF924 family)